MLMSSSWQGLGPLGWSCQCFPRRQSILVAICLSASSAFTLRQAAHPLSLEANGRSALEAPAPLYHLPSLTSSGSDWHWGEIQENKQLDQLNKRSGTTVGPQWACQRRILQLKLLFLSMWKILLFIQLRCIPDFPPQKLQIQNPLFKAQRAEIPCHSQNHLSVVTADD